MSLKGQKSPGSGSSSIKSFTTGFPRAAGKWPLEERDRDGRGRDDSKPLRCKWLQSEPKTGAGGVKVRSGGVARVG